MNESFIANYLEIQFSSIQLYFIHKICNTTVTIKIRLQKNRHFLGLGRLNTFFLQPRATLIFHRTCRRSLDFYDDLNRLTSEYIVVHQSLTMFGNK